MFRSFLSSLTRFRYFLIFRFLLILLCSLPVRQSPQFSRFFFSCWQSLVLDVWLRLGELFVSQNLREVRASHFPGRILIVHMPFVHMVKLNLLTQFPVDHFFHPVMSSVTIFLFWFIILILLTWVFFTPALADGFHQGSEWQQVSSSLQVSSQYSGRSQQCQSLDGLHLSSYFQVLQSLYQSFGGCTERTNYNWYHCYLHVPWLFQFWKKAKKKKKKKVSRTC